MILTDKTGTLTEGSSKVDKVFINGSVYNVGYDDQSEFHNYINQSDNQNIKKLFTEAVSLNSDSDLKIVNNIDGIRHY